MLKYLGTISFIVLFTIGCSSTTDSAKNIASVDAETLKTQWDMTGRAPEWTISINGNRFHGSFPGRYEGRMVSWTVVEQDQVTRLNAPNNLASIVLTETECSVADQNYTHSAVVKINKQTFKGCAKHKS